MNRGKVAPKVTENRRDWIIAGGTSSISRQGLFFIPLIIILPHFFGLLGVEICQAISDVISLIVTIPIVWTAFRDSEIKYGHNSVFLPIFA